MRNEALRNDWQLALAAGCTVPTGRLVTWYKERLCASALCAPLTVAVTLLALPSAALCFL